MARNIFDLESTACAIQNLPFPDNAFNAVLCSKTIEHVADYKKAVDELLRITKNTLIISVPHESPEIVAETIRKKIPRGHINYFDIHTLDYLKERGYAIRYEKSLSPLLTKIKVLAEGFKKSNDKIQYRIYNAFTQAFKKIFGIKTAHRLVNIDEKFTKLFGLYYGITFVIENQRLS